MLAGCKEENNDIIVLSDNDLVLFVGETKTLTYVVTPLTSSDKDVIWRSSNFGVVSAYEGGIIIAKETGEATITAEVYGSGATSSCRVVVNPRRAENVEISDSEINIIVGNTFRLSHTIIPAGSTNQRVTWNSSDPNTSDIDANGLVTAKVIGVCTITVKTDDGGFEAFCLVNVKPIPVSGITIQAFDGIYREGVFVTTKVLIGHYESVTTKIYPENAANKEIVFKSSDDEIAIVEYVNNNEYYIIGKKIGTTNVIAKTVDGDHEAVCEVSVCDLDAFAHIEFGVGTGGDLFDGFYSYLDVYFGLNKNIPVNIKEIKITNDVGNKVYVFDNIGERVIYRCPRIITAEGLLIYQAIGWKAEVIFEWRGKEYYVFSIKQ
jgi:uncharacterized protein YjdB